MSQVKTDQFGRMKVNELKKAIKRAINQQKLPFFVNATAGTAVFGAIDPLPEIAQICWLERIWLHVDVRMRYESSSLGNQRKLIRKLLQARVSGALMFSKGFRHRLRGIKRFVVILVSRTGSYDKFQHRCSDYL